MEKMSHELLPCPFCGGEAEERVKGRGTSDPKYYVRCAECGCRTGETVCSPAHIRTWNRRVTDAKDDPGEDFYREQQQAAWERYCKEMEEV